MTEVFVSTDDIKVIGGTSNVNVSLDFGPQGDRGSVFLVGLGNPNDFPPSLPLQALDVYLNVKSTDSDYLMLYQFQDQNGVTQWIETSKLITDKHSVIRNVLFSNGVANDSVDFRVINIVPTSLLGSLTESSFNIQATFSNPTKPIAHSIVVKPITLQAGTGDVILPISINAAEFSGSEWSPINGTHIVHFLITVV
jgi:hypothetical protein